MPSVVEAGFSDLVVTSKNANVATGEQGLADALEIVTAVASRLGAQPDDVLIAQDHTTIGPEQYVHHVLPALTHPDYLRVDGAAVLSIYRPGQIPHLREVTDEWRRVARAAGAGELLLLAVDEVLRMFWFEQEVFPGGIPGHRFETEEQRLGHPVVSLADWRDGDRG